MRLRLLASLLAGLVLALASCGDDGDGTGTAGTEADVDDLTIEVSEAGVQSLGEFRPQVEGLIGATEAFGEPTATNQDGLSLCVVGWEPLGLEIQFANLGGEDACAPQSGRVASIVIREAPEAGRWVTAEGLRIGNDLTTLQELYPGAHELTPREVPAAELADGQTAYSLYDMATPIGDLGSISTLTAVVAGDGVAGFLMHVGAAGE